MTPREKKNAQNRERIVAQKSEYQRRPEVKYLRKLRRCEFSQSVSV